MKKHFLLVSALWIISDNLCAQWNFQAINAQNASGTYTDLGTLGTKIDTNYLGGLMTYDDDVSRLTDIGFAFNFNGGTYTKFFLGSNGYIKLASLSSVPPDPFVIGSSTPDFLTAADSNIIAPFCFDLDAGSATPEYRVNTSGVAGSRICVIQFKNLRDFSGGQYSNISFQIKLFEANGNIEFIYGNFQSTGVTLPYISPFVGVKGNNDANSVNVTKQSAQQWSAGVFINGAYANQTPSVQPFNNRNSVLPDAGRTFRFISTPPPPNDAEVQYAYTLGEIPLVYGTPHAVSARIRNKGTNTLTNLVVSLSITGSNTFSASQTISSLAPGAIVTVPFAVFTPTVAGTNVVTVSVPADDDNTNNSRSVNQQVTSGTFSYADDAPAVGAVGAGTGSGLILTRYFINGTAQVTNVVVHISSDTRNVGKTIYAVVMNNLGQIIDSSANFVIQPSHLGTYRMLDIITPRTITNSFFYAGIAQLALPGDFQGYYPVSYQDEGDSTRIQAYYEALISGGGLVQQNSLGRFMIKAVLNNTIVPVNMRTFSATRNGNVNDLRWETSSEINVVKYVIERSERGNGGFGNIGSVNAVQSPVYDFTDMMPLQGMNFYRLRAIDIDGKETVSEIRSVRNERRIRMIVYPNPVGERMNVSVYSQSGGETLLMINSMEGRRVYMRKINLPAGNSNIVLDHLNIQAGTYMLEMLTNRERQVQQIIKE